MKKKLMMGLALVAALAFVSCKSSESSYKKAYEKAKAQEMARTNTTDQVETAPVTVTPVVTTTPVTTTPVANTENDRQERLTVMNGGTLKAFNVVCGSFSNVDNANNLRNTLVSKGYSAQVAQNPETGMYRVIAASFDDRATAVQSRDQLRGTYPDAWLLYRTY
ncbi:MAG: SPOR domain-containing protein [Bacteroidaceae bacterium]|nr:SPOR domain-containing protein [Bacteroidaceae bacterium]